MPSFFATTLTRADHVQSFVVQPSYPTGWEASKRSDEQIIHRKHYEDWHRVERTLDQFTREIASLREQGWREIPQG